MCTQCLNQEATTATGVNDVPNFAVTGVRGVNNSKARLPELEGVTALGLSVCVAASYNPGNNQICFNIPIYGNFCITSPVQIPVGGVLQACAQTCGSIIPTGLQVTIYLNNNKIWSGTLVGSC